MTGLLSGPERDEEATSQQRPLVTIGISAAGIAGLVALAMKFGVFTLNAAPTVTNANLLDALASHHKEVMTGSKVTEDTLRRMERLLQIDCLHHSKTDVERGQCLDVR